MNKIERVKMVKAMEFIARHVNDERAMHAWLAAGVAYGDILPNDLSATRDEDLSIYYEDTIDFADLMCTFVNVMRKVPAKRGLYCDGVVSYPMFED